MGGNISHVATEAVTNSVLDVIVSQNSDCKTVLTGDQLLNIKATGNSKLNLTELTQDGAFKYNLSCMSKSLNNTTLMQEIAQKVSEQITQKLGSLSFTGNNKIDSQTKSFINAISKVSVSSNNTCFNASTFSQKMDIIATDNSEIILAKANQTLTQELVANCVFSNTNINNLATTLDNTLEKAILQEKYGVIGELFAGLSQLLSTITVPGAIAIGISSFMSLICLSLFCCIYFYYQNQVGDVISAVI